MRGDQGDGEEEQGQSEHLREGSLTALTMRDEITEEEDYFSIQNEIRPLLFDIDSAMRKDSRI